jgi:hypothetical protein
MHERAGMLHPHLQAHHTIKVTMLAWIENDAHDDATRGGAVQRVNHPPIGEDVGGDIDAGLRCADQRRVDAVNPFSRREMNFDGVVAGLRVCNRHERYGYADHTGKKGYSAGKRVLHRRAPNARKCALIGRKGV